MKTYRAFRVRYIPATDTKPSRVSIHDLRNNKRKVISYNHEFSNIYQIAEKYLSDIGITCCGVSEASKGYILFTDNFRISIKGGEI